MLEVLAFPKSDIEIRLTLVCHARLRMFFYDIRECTNNTIIFLEFAKILMKIWKTVVCGRFLSIFKLKFNFTLPDCLENGHYTIAVLFLEPQMCIWELGSLFVCLAQL